MVYSWSSIWAKKRATSSAGGLSFTAFPATTFIFTYNKQICVKILNFDLARYKKYRMLFDQHIWLSTFFQYQWKVSCVHFNKFGNVNIKNRNSDACFLCTTNNCSSLQIYTHWFNYSPLYSTICQGNLDSKVPKLKSTALNIIRTSTKRQMFFSLMFRGSQN